MLQFYEAKKSHKALSEKELYVLLLLVPSNILINRKPEPKSTVQPRQEEGECKEKEKSRKESAKRNNGAN